MRSIGLALLALGSVLGCRDGAPSAPAPERDHVIAQACDPMLPEADLETAITELVKYADRDDGTASLLTGLLQLQGKRIERNDATGRARIERSADAGSSLAQGALGSLYDLGVAGLKQDHARAEQLHWQAAEAGNARSQQILGVYLERGVNGTRDMEAAAGWYRKSAEQGDPRGQTNLASLYERGEGVPQSLPDAVTWYRRAAAQYTDLAIASLGVIYTSGEAPFDDPIEGMSLLEVAAATNAGAQHNLALEYRKRGDESLAMRYFERAAEQGMAFSQFQLSLGYEQGRGVAADPARAYEWAVLAAMSNEGPPVERRDTLRHQLSPEAVARGQKLADEWMRAQERKRAEFDPLAEIVDYVCLQATRGGE